MKAKLIHQFFQVSRTMSLSLNQRLAQYKLTHAQLSILDYLLVQTQSISLVDIAKYLAVEKSTVTRTVKQLEQVGLVQHIPSADSREKRIVLSEQFRLLQADLQLTKTSFETDAFHGISPEELQRTYDTLLKIMNNFNGDDSEQHEKH